jgi:hypothetical protein
MRFGQGTPTDIFSWFQESSRAHWLGFFLAGDDQYNKLMNGVLDNADLINTISGYHIDLFVFNTGQQIQLKGSGHDIQVNATPLTPLHQDYEYLPADFRERHLLVSGIDDVNLTAAKKRSMIKMSGRATNDLMEFLGLGIDDIPSLVLIHKSFDYVDRQPVLVLRTRGQADADFLIEFLRAVRRLSETHRKAAAHLEKISNNRDVDAIFDTELDNTQLVRHRIKRQVAFLIKAVGEHGFEANADKIIGDILTASNPQEGIEHALSSCGITSDKLTQLVNADPKIQNVCSEIAKSRQRLDFVLAASEQYAKQIESGLAEFEALIAEFDRKISFQIEVNRVLSFLKFSTVALKKAKQLIKLLGAIKTGGTSLLG